MTDPIISVRGLSKLYPIGKESASNLHVYRDLIQPLFARQAPADASQEAPEGMFWALRNIEFHIQPGERIGIIGRNGAGKSTLLKILSRVTYPTTGEAVIRGRVTSLLEVGTGFNDSQSGRANIFLNATLHGLTRAEINARIEDIIEFSEIRRFIDTPLGHYSTGMRARLAFSIAAHLDPDVLILDEILAVGDLAFQQKCLDRMDQLTGAHRTLVLVSHSMSLLTRYCDRCLWLQEGRIIKDGDAAEVAAAYTSASLDVRPAYHGETVRKDAARPTDIAAKAKTACGPAPNIVTDSWSDEPEAELISARVRDSRGDASALFPLDSPIVIHMRYRRLSECLMIPSIAVFGPDNTLLFWTVPPSKDRVRFTQTPGIYETSVVLPAHFLNVGRYSITLAMASPDQTPMKRHFHVENALSFHMVEGAQSENEARGLLPREFPGPLRPALSWQDPTPVTDDEESDDEHE